MACCTEQTQAYYWSTVASNEFPAGIAVLDGPRGVGTVAMATHLQVGRNGGVYFCDPWRVGQYRAERHDPHVGRVAASAAG